MTYREALEHYVDACNMCTSLNCSECEMNLAIKALEEAIKHEETFEWCTDCKEYDQKNHCCHRWSKNIKRTIESSRKLWYNEGFKSGEIYGWKDAYEQGYDEGYMNGYQNAE